MVHCRQLGRVVQSPLADQDLQVYQDLLQVLTVRQVHVRLHYPVLLHCLVFHGYQANRQLRRIPLSQVVQVLRENLYRQT